MSLAELAPVGAASGELSGEFVASHGEFSGEFNGVGPGAELEHRRDERGMVSAEWAVGILAAIAIAGVLLAVVTNGPVQDALLKFILFVINSFSGLMIK